LSRPGPVEHLGGFAVNALQPTLELGQRCRVEAGPATQADAEHCDGVSQHRSGVATHEQRPPHQPVKKHPEFRGMLGPQSDSLTAKPRIATRDNRGRPLDAGGSGGDSGQRGHRRAGLTKPPGKGGGQWIASGRLAHAPAQHLSGIRYQSSGRSVHRNTSAGSGGR